MLGPAHGACGFLSSAYQVSFATNETIIKIDVGAAFINQIMEICYMQFYTNIATYGPYKGCSVFNTYSLSLGLAYLMGNCGSDLDGLQLAYYN